jgi:O-antigen/teichoic acid export membrane protein
MFRLLAPATVAVFALLFAYAALVGVAGKQLLGLLYGGAYDQYAPLIWYVGLGYLFVHLTQAAALALMVQGRTRSIFISRVVVVPFTLTAGMWITWQCGLYGAAFASCVLASGAILAMQYALLIGRERRGRGTSRSDTSLVPTGGEIR